MSNLGFVPAFAFYVLLVNWRVLKRPGILLGAAALFVLGCLQFLWLPYKAATLNDPLMLRNAPRTLQGIYRHTLGAFPQLLNSSSSFRRHALEGARIRPFRSCTLWPTVV